MSDLIYSNNHNFRVALGQVEGWQSFRKFGQNDGVVSGAEEMWSIGTPRVLPTSAGQFSAVSSSAEDTLTSGTGAWTLVIEGLDSNYKVISETINMAGLTPVLSTRSDWLRINRAYNVTAGTNQRNVGNITISIGGNAQAYVQAEEGQTQQTHYTVPDGKIVIVNNFTMGVGRMSGSNDLHIKSSIKLFGTNTAWRAISEIWLWNGDTYSNNNSVTVIPAKTEIKQEIVSTTATQAFCVYGGYLVESTELQR